MSDLSRLLLILSSISQHDGNNHLERATHHVLTPLAKLAQTLEHMQEGLALLSNKKSRNDLLTSILPRDATSNSPQARVAVAMACTGPWLDRGDVDNLCEVVAEVAGRDRYFDPGLWLMHLAAILFYERRGVSLETLHTKLNYPIRCPLTRIDSATVDQNALLPESQRGRHHVVVVGLHGHGKSALVGRMIQVLGQSSPLALSRVRSAARRVLPDHRDTADAVWYADRTVTERTERRTSTVRGFPLYHSSVGSFVVVDTPPFADYYVENREKKNFPRLEKIRRSASWALTVLKPDLVVVCVAVDLHWTDDQLASLVLQVQAATLWPDAMGLVFAVTRMDRLEWSQEQFHRTAQRIRNIAGDTVEIIPTAAIAPAHGIVRPPLVDTWVKDRPLPSLLSIMFERSSGKQDSSPQPTTLAKAYIVCKACKTEGSTMLVQAILLQGRIVVGQHLQIEKRDTPSFQVESIEWYGYPMSNAYVGQLVGLKLRILRKDYLRHEAGIRFSVLSTWTQGQPSNETKSDPVKLLVNLQLPDPKEVEGLCFVAYPANQRSFCWNKMDILGEPNKWPNGTMFAKIEIKNQSTNFYLGQRLLLYRQNEAKELIGFGVVAEEELPSALEWLSRSLIARTKPAPATPATHPPMPLPPLQRLTSSQRGVSVFSTLSMGLSSLGAGNLDSSGPASSIEEAIRQTDSGIKTLVRLREELERTKSVLDRTNGTDSATESCYMCLRHCPKLLDSESVPICSACTALNEAKRSSPLGLSSLDEDSAFVVTGARIKIGYATVKRLLSEGAQMLILTTRFPFQLADKLVKELPEDLKRATVHIYGSDFRNVPSVMSLADHLAEYYPKVVALINNAAQTVKRPPAFYAAIVEKELAIARKPGALARLVKIVGTDPFEDTSVSSEALAKLDANQPMSIMKSFHDCQAFPSCASALMTQCQTLPEDAFISAEKAAELFPSSNEDVDSSTGEAVMDLREFTSWRKSILPNKDTCETVETVEFLEVLLVNTLAPFVLLKSLAKSLQAASGNVVNVSSREGVFARVKFSEHPHTNAGKAGLNMLTRSAAYELKRVNVMICSVDTGWVSKYHKSGLHPDGTPKGRTPPLTVDDAAARILDPIAQRFQGASEGKKFRTGLFYRDFKATPYV